MNNKNKCYFFSKDLHTFDDAKATCELKSASLLIISDIEEHVSHYKIQHLYCKVIYNINIYCIILGFSH